MVLNTDFITSSSTYVSVTGYNFPVEANSTYNFQFWPCYKSSGTTTGFGLSITGPASPALIAGWVSVHQAAGQFINMFTAYDGGNIGGTTAQANAVYCTPFVGTIRTTNAGTLQVRMARGGAGTNVVMVAGSSGILTKLS